MKKLSLFLSICLFLMLSISTGFAQEQVNWNTPTSEIIEDWPKASQHVAENIMNKFGPPDERTPSRLIWYEDGKWNLTVVRKNPIQHNFPYPHKDVLYQNIKYDVPVGEISKLLEFDGSLIIEETRGTLGVRCDRMAANYIAINLAHQIIEGELSVEEARQKYGELIVMMMKGKSSKFYSGFIFSVPRNQMTADPGERVIPKSTIQKLMNMKMKKMDGMNMGKKKNEY